jgi:hypothetical protein
VTDPAFYRHTLYPFQDVVLAAVHRLDVGFYLTGGTAAERGYLDHRFSDDVDLFVNDDARFRLWAERVLQGLAATWTIEVSVREERFMRFEIVSPAVSLKVELVNDVPAHVGEITLHPVLGRLDSAENILANKLTALVDRQEPKDLADVWGLCCRLGLRIESALEGTQSKAAGLFPPDVARALLSAERSDWELVRWTIPPDAGQYVADLHRLGDGLLVGQAPA